MIDGRESAGLAVSAMPVSVETSAANFTYRWRDHVAKVACREPSGFMLGILTQAHWSRTFDAAIEPNTRLNDGRWLNQEPLHPFYLPGHSSNICILEKRGQSAELHLIVRNSIDEWPIMEPAPLEEAKEPYFGSLQAAALSWLRLDMLSLSGGGRSVGFHNAWSRDSIMLLLVFRYFFK